MNIIESHMEQIALSSAAIIDLPFPPPKIFTNSLLHPHDITALIRDTEAHERALFKVAPPEPGSFEPVTRRNTIYPNAEGFANATSYPGIKSTTTVGRILGGDLLARVRRTERSINREKQDVDVEVLLRGAEKLCNVYPVPGVTERIQDLRTRHTQVTLSIEQLQDYIAEQSAQLNQMNRSWDDDILQNEPMQGISNEELNRNKRYSDEDFVIEEAEMEELEQKKKGLQSRVSGLDKDLNGLRDR